MTLDELRQLDTTTLEHLSVYLRAEYRKVDDILLEKLIEKMLNN